VGKIADRSAQATRGFPLHVMTIADK